MFGQVLGLVLLAVPFVAIYFGLKACLRVLWRDPDAERLARVERITKRGRS